MTDLEQCVSMYSDAAKITVIAQGELQSSQPDL